MSSKEKGLLSPDGTTTVGYLDSPEAIRTIQWLNAYYHDSGQDPEIKNIIDNFLQFDSSQVGMILGDMRFTFPNSMGELDYATTSTDSSFSLAWDVDKDLTVQFEKLLTTKDEDIPTKLHELALKFDQALKKSNIVSVIS